MDGGKTGGGRVLHAGGKKIKLACMLVRHAADGKKYLYAFPVHK